MMKAIRNPDYQTGFGPFLVRIGLLLVRLGTYLFAGFVIGLFVATISERLAIHLATDETRLGWRVFNARMVWWVFDCFIVTSLIALWRQVASEFRGSVGLGAALASIAVIASAYAIVVMVWAYFFSPEGV